MDEQEIDQNKNANNKVDISYNFWLGIKYVDRTFFDGVVTEASIRRIREVLDE
jgi:hypothetical protein